MDTNYSGEFASLISAFISSLKCIIRENKSYQRLLPYYEF